MTESDKHETDMARLLAGHDQEVAMDTRYHDALLSRTTVVVARRARRALGSRAPRLGAAVALLAVAIGAWRLFGDRRPQVRYVAPPPLSSPDVLAALPGAAVTPEEGGPLVAVIAARGSVVDVQAEPIAVGDKLPVGVTVRTGADARATLITRRGSEFTLAPSSALWLESAHSARLVAGRLYCRSRAGEISQIATAPGTIQLLGTTVETTVEDEDTVAVTVLAGRVRLTNSRGQADVPSGRRALLTSSSPPEPGQTIDPYEAADWYYGRGDVVSDFGDIAYLVTRENAEGLACEVWAMDPDGSNRRRLKTYLGVGQRPGPWLPGQQWLVFKTFRLSLSTRHFEGDRVRTDGGFRFSEIDDWLINAPTGQDLLFELPPDYTALYTDLSPDGSRLAFCGSYQPDPRGNAEDGDWGVWVFDMNTGEVKKLLDGDIYTPISWAPDSRRLVADTAQGYVLHHPLVVVDADTGEVRDLGVNGAGGIFSPDGRKIAYPGEFQRGGSYFDGVPVSGRIMVYDLVAGEAVPISPAGEGALHPRWSPDGCWVAYCVTVTDRRHEGEVGRRLHQALFIAAANGSTIREVLESEEQISGYAWMPSGDALYLVMGNGIRVIAADGSGLLSDLGGNAEDALLSPGQDRQTEAALDAVRQAEFQYAVGNDRSFEGKPSEAKAAYQAAADIYAGLAWEYPLAQFSLDQLMLYADRAAAEAGRSRAEVLAESCQARLGYLERLLLGHIGATGELPSDLAAAEKRFLDSHAVIDHISSEDTEWVKMMFRCSEAGPYSYHRPSDDPHIGDVLVSCGGHPDNILVWTEEAEQQLASYRQAPE